MSTASDTFAKMFWTLLMLFAAVSVIGGPFWLYRRYRKRYGEGESFRLEWTEKVAEGAFRGGEQTFEQKVRVTPAGEWAAKLGFFLGIVGFLWTPVVLAGVVSGDLPPMVTIGLPGLVVSWSVFFASRAMLKDGPAAAPLMKFAGVSEIVLNVWVLAVVALSTMYKSGLLGDDVRQTISAVLAAGSSKSNPMGAYTLVYGLQELGLLAVGYAMVSFFHANLMLRAWSSMEAARQVQLKAATAAA